MNYFFSGSPPMGVAADQMIEACTHRLLTCHYMGFAHKWFQRSRMHGGQVHEHMLLDSGAFSAWSVGEPVSLDLVIRRYEELLEKYSDLAGEWFFINLDVIPGSKGVTPTPDQINQALYQSDKNYEALYARYGYRVLPVFHQGEDWERLEFLKRQNPYYICVSPRNDLHEGLRREWSALVHQRIPRNTFTHGLATTGRMMMENVPWYSVDSASWVMTAAMGGVSLYYNGRINNVVVSAESPKLRELGQHVMTMPQAEREAVIAIIESYGCDFEISKIEPSVRCYITMRATYDYLAAMRKGDQSAQQGLFE